MELTVRQVADRFNTSRRNVYNWIEAGLFPNAHTQEGSREWRIPESDLENFTPPARGWRRGRPRKARTDSKQ